MGATGLVQGLNHDGRLNIAIIVVVDGKRGPSMHGIKNARRGFKFGRDGDDITLEYASVALQ